MNLILELFYPVAIIVTVVTAVTLYFRNDMRAPLVSSRSGGSLVTARSHSSKPLSLLDNLFGKQQFSQLRIYCFCLTTVVLLQWLLASIKAVNPFISQSYHDLLNFRQLVAFFCYSFLSIALVSPIFYNLQRLLKTRLQRRQSIFALVAHLNNFVLLSIIATTFFEYFRALFGLSVVTDANSLELLRFAVSICSLFVSILVIMALFRERVLAGHLLNLGSREFDRRAKILQREDFSEKTLQPMSNHDIEDLIEVGKFIDSTDKIDLASRVLMERLLKEKDESRAEESNS